MVPGRGDVGVRFLHQHVLVKQAHAARAHEPRRDARGRRFEDEAAELGNPIPIAVVAEMPALAGRAVIDARIGPGRFDIAGDAGAQDFHPLRERAAQHDGAVGAEGGDIGVGDGDIGVRVHDQYPCDLQEGNETTDKRR